MMWRTSNMCAAFRVKKKPLGEFRICQWLAISTPGTDARENYLNDVKFACLIFCFLYPDFCYLVTLFPFPLLFVNLQRNFGKMVNHFHERRYIPGPVQHVISPFRVLSRILCTVGSLGMLRILGCLFLRLTVSGALWYRVTRVAHHVCLSQFILWYSTHYASA